MIIRLKLTLNSERDTFKRIKINTRYCSFLFQISHFLEEKFIGEYTDNIRELAGYLNTLAKIVRNDNQRNMGLHLFDQSLA